ncbi:hypothetical protein ACT4S5_13170 [Kocuria oceani]|uniref:hypothetical protein n=1 Tax=Kocuria oceani TaxID=988827 RepID=UPI0040350117
MTAVAAPLRAVLPSLIETAGTATDRNPNKEVVVDARNRYVLAEVFRNDRDAALAWGAAHLPGMGQILTDAGLELAGCCWRPVMAKRRVVDGVRGSIAALSGDEVWPWDGAHLPESVPADQARALINASGWLTAPVPARAGLRVRNSGRP